MEQTIRALYKLQQIDLELDDLEAGSGDLPKEIEQLETQLAEIDSQIAGFENDLTEARKERNEGNMELQELRARTLKLNERLRSVRDNKEYDATTSEIESAEQRTQDLTANLAGIDHREAEAMRGRQNLEKTKEELTKSIEEKKETLEAIQESSSDEVVEYRKQREEALEQIPGDMLDKYRHVRTAHADAVVKVRKGACAGCYRAVTPQTLVEMRKNEEVFLCEHCGRLLVDEEIADSVEVGEEE